MRWLILTLALAGCEPTKTSIPPVALVNGDAETCTLDDWVASSDAIDAVDIQSQATGNVTPHGGDCFFTFAAAKETGTISLVQQGELGPRPGLTLTGWTQRELAAPDGNDDVAILALRLLDENGAEFSRDEAKLSEDAGWNEASLEVTVPESASVWEVRLEATLQYGEYINVFFDDLTLEAQ